MRAPKNNSVMYWIWCFLATSLIWSCARLIKTYLNSMEMCHCKIVHFRCVSQLVCGVGSILKVEHNQMNLVNERLPCPLPTTITITPRTYIYIYIYEKLVEKKCPQGYCIGNLELNSATSRNGGRYFNNLRGCAFIRLPTVSNRIFWLKNVNRMRGRWIQITPTVFRISLLTISAQVKL